jgi:hypothetical protein
MLAMAKVRLMAMTTLKRKAETVCLLGPSKTTLDS